jgi:hypothetical protein
MTRILTLALLALVVGLPAVAQTETHFAEQWAGGGLFFNQDNHPQINGMLAYAKRVTTLAGHPGYSFTKVNIWSISRNDPTGSIWTMNYRVATSTETGWAQHALDYGPFKVFGTFTAGPMFSGSPDGTTVGASLSTGGFAFAGIGKGWTIGPALNIIKPIVTEAANPDAGKLGWSLGLVVGWGR